MQTATSETESKSRDLIICVHHYTLRAPCPEGQGKVGQFRTVSPFVRGSPDHSNNVQTGRRDWGVIGTSRSHWLARSCARRARVVKTDPEQQLMVRNDRGAEATCYSG